MLDQPSIDQVSYLLGGTAFTLMWLISLLSGSVLMGGGLTKLAWLRRRENPVGYIAAMILIACIACFCWVEAAGTLGWRF